MFYEGEVDDDMRFHGRGKETFANGDVYEGEYRNGNRHGEGKIEE